MKTVTLVTTKLLRNQVRTDFVIELDATNIINVYKEILQDNNDNEL